MRVAATGDFAELAAVLPPCMWGYARAAGAGASTRGRPPEKRSARWAAMYASEDFEAIASWCRGLVDRLAAGAGEDGRERRAVVAS